MHEAEHHSLSALIVWKCLKHLPGQRRERGSKPRIQPQNVLAQESQTLNGQRRRHEPEIRHLPQRLRPPSLKYSHHRREANRTQKASEQTESPLFRLPIEIRQIVYEQLLGGRVFHVVRRREKLGHTSCKVYRGPDQCVPARCRGLKLPSGIHAGFGNGDLIQILQSCQRLYSESVEILYSRNVFDFDCLENLIAFSCAVLPQSLDSIRKLRLDFQFNQSIFFSECTPRNDWPRWERTWRIISSMLALQEIRMRLSCKEFLKNEAEEERLLEPLQLVKGLKTFEIRMPLSRLHRQWEGRDMPFNIVAGT